MEKVQALQEEARELLEQRRYHQLKNILAGALPPDIVEIIQDLEVSEQVILFRLLSKETAAEVFSLLNHEEQEELLEHFSRDAVKGIIEEMDPDDRAELFEELPDAMVRRLIRLLSPEDRSVLNQLLNYPEDSAGRLMTPELIKIERDLTAQQAIDRIRRTGINKETIYYSYVVDEQETLIGAVSLRQLLFADPGTPVEELMTTNLVYVNTHEDQEEVARILSRYDLSALPVVDHQQKLVGIITIDDVVDVIEEEATEDFHKMAGMGATEAPYFATGFFLLGRKRALWLVVLLVTSYLSSIVLKHYSPVLEIVIPLAFFIPMLTGTCGNSGMQSATLIIRGLAVGEVVLQDVFRILAREILMGAFLGVVLGGFAYLRALFLEVNPLVGVSVGLAVLISVITANTIGSMLPLILKKLRIDPAISAGPFISTIIDVTTLLLYFEIAKLLFGISP
ncbi:MAG: magnesium transporter [Spirochaetota bacterium]